MENTGAFRKWKDLLHGDFMLDAAGFILGSIIPYSYIEMIGDEQMVLVDYIDLRQHTNSVNDAIDLLVSLGYARWYRKDEVAEFDGSTAKRRGDTNFDSIIIGTAQNFMDCTYFFEKKTKETIGEVKPARVTRPTRRPVQVVPSNIPTIPEIPDQLDLSDIEAFINRHLNLYKVYCSKISLRSAPQKIEKKITEVLKKVRIGQILTAIDLLTYFDCSSALVNSWHDVPDRYTKPNLFASAKSILNKGKADDILRVVNYFLEEYPKWAPDSFNDTSITVLSFKYGACVNKMGLKKPIAKGYEDDTL